MNAPSAAHPPRPEDWTWSGEVAHVAEVEQVPELRGHDVPAAHGAAQRALVDHRPQVRGARPAQDPLAAHAQLDAALDVGLERAVA